VKSFSPLVVILALVLPAAAESGSVERALDSELSRAMTQLDESGYPPPYFVGLSALDVATFEQRCSMGATSSSSSYHQRLIVPDVRVGDYAFDNHPVSPPANFAGTAATLEDDEFALRHDLWLMFDSSYKSATADFLRKQALRVQRGKTEYDFDDLSRESPRSRPSMPPTSPWPAGSLEGLCESASGAFRAAPRLLEATAEVQRKSVWSRLRNSEKFNVDMGREIAELELSAVDISTDGLRLYATRRFTGASAKDMPSVDEVQDQAKEMIADLDALKLAQTTSPFSAPALIDPSVSAAVVLAFGLRLSGEEQRDPGGAQIFKGKVGKPVLPEDFELEDDPTVDSFKGTPLVGHYEFDDQGIQPQRVALITDGVLKGFLLSRYPVIGFPNSNGHGRAFAGYHPVGSPGSLFLRSKRPLSQGKLLDLLREECRKRGKPYGIWVKKLRRFSQQQGTSGHGSIRLMPEMLYLVDAKTGALTLVRDLDMVGTPLDLMSGILKAGDDVEAQNMDWNVPVSVVVPSLLLSDAELQRAETKPEKHPILPPPPVAQDGPMRAPMIPVVPYIGVNRYLVHGFKGPLPRYVMSGLLGSRAHSENDDYVIEAKVMGRSLTDLENGLGRMLSAAKSLTKDGRVDETVLSPAMTQAAYQALHGDGWPEDSPGTPKKP
jgi:hypothetical protein